MDSLCHAHHNEPQPVYRGLSKLIHERLGCFSLTIGAASIAIAAGITGFGLYQERRQHAYESVVQQIDANRNDRADPVEAIPVYDALGLSPPETPDLSDLSARQLEDYLIIADCEARRAIPRAR